MDKILENLTYTVDYRDIKFPRLEFRTGTLLLVLPKNHKDPTQLLQKHKKWIQHKTKTIEKALQEAKTKTLNQSRTTKELKTLVKSTIQKHKPKLNTEINHIYYREMKTKWASCSPKNNLTINTLLKHLPQPLIEYVTYHELAHTKQRKHNETFWKLIKKEFPDHQTKEKDLLAYWFLIQKQQTRPSIVTQRIGRQENLKRV